MKGDDVSAHYSKFDLNTYKGTAYFIAHTPDDYPLERVLQESRSFRRLPPRLREMAGLAKQWAKRKYPQYPAGTPDIEYWYDDDGYELNPTTGDRLTDEEVNADWDSTPAGDMGSFEVIDIPELEGGFADPKTWEEPALVLDEGEDEEDRITEEQLLKDIQSHGREWVTRDYSVPKEQMEDVDNDRGLASIILETVKERRAANQ